MSVFLSDADLKQKLLDTLQKEQFEEAMSWDTIITDSNKAAYDDIVSALVGNGYAIEQVLAWDAGPTYAIDLALFWCLIKGGCTKDFDPKFISQLDRRKELLAIGDTGVGLTVGGTLVYAISRKRVDSGKLKNKCDVFTMDMTW